PTRSPTSFSTATDDDGPAHCLNAARFWSALARAASLRWRIQRTPVRLRSCPLIDTQKAILWIRHPQRVKTPPLTKLDDLHTPKASDVRQSSNSQTRFLGSHVFQRLGGAYAGCSFGTRWETCPCVLNARAAASGDDASETA